MTHLDDRGLRAVARVRSVREQDSRIGLQQAVSQVRETASALVVLEEQLASGVEALGVARGSVADFRALQLGVDGLNRRVHESRSSLLAAEAVARAARDRWAADHSRLRAVETLLANRALERRREAARAEVRELDDLAGRGWLRGRRAATERARSSRHDSGGAA